MTTTTPRIRYADLARAYNEAHDAALKEGRQVATDPAVLAAKRALEAYEAR